MNKGKLIVIEGACDGIGKTTQFNMLCSRLEKEGYKIYHHHFPSYNTYQGKGVESYLKGDFGLPNNLSPYFINSLYAHDRAVTWYDILKEKYDEGYIILLDRYTTSSLIYQSALIKDQEEKNNFINYVTDFEYNKLGIKEPDLVIFLNADYDLVKALRNKRINNEGIEHDIHESNDEFMKQVYDNALYVSNYLGWENIKCDTDTSFKSIEEIHDEIYKTIK